VLLSRNLLEAGLRASIRKLSHYHTASTIGNRAYM